MDGGKSWFKEPLKKGLKAVKQRLKNRKNQAVSIKRQNKVIEQKQENKNRSTKRERQNSSVKI